MKSLKVIFMGTPDFALPALKALLESPHKIVAVYTQPPRKAGRGMKPRKSPVHRLAEKSSLAVLTPENFRKKEDIATFWGHQADAAVVAAYGLILPEDILKAPRLGCLNIHASLLPRWRGASPIHRAILAEDKKSGITIMQMEKGLDTGPVLEKKAIPLGRGETAGSLHDKLAVLGGKMIVPVLEGWAEGRIKPEPQDDRKSTYAPKIEKDELAIDWEDTAEEIERKVRAFYPYPGTWFRLKNKRIRILEGKKVKDHGEPGEVLDNHLSIACGQGAYRILSLQPEGKKPMETDAFLRGTPVPAGEVLD